MIILRSTDFKREPGNDMWSALVEAAQEKGLIPEDISVDDCSEFEITVEVTNIL